MKYNNLNSLKFLLSTFVVCLHCVGPNVEFLSFCVPIFFLISGYLFFSNQRNVTINYSFFLQKWERRILTLLIPYICWILLYYIYMRLVESQRLAEMMEGKNWIRIFWDANPDGGNPLLGPYWYVRDLIKCCLLAPLLYELIKNKYIGAIIVFVLILSYVFYPISFRFIGSDALLFFSLGAYLGIHKIALPALRYPIYLLLFIIVSVFFMFTYCFDYGYRSIAHSVYILLCFPFLYYSMDLAQKWIKLPKIIDAIINSSCSFFIYSIHMFFYSFAFYITTDCMKLEHGSRTLATPMVLLLSFCSYWVMKQYFPVVLNVLTGSRDNRLKMIQ